MRRLLRLYPPAWRARYEGEVAVLLDDLAPDRHMALDLFRGAVREWAHTAWRRIPEAPVPVGGPPAFFRPLERHPTTLAVIALVVVAPTATFVFLSVLAYELGVSGLRAIIDPAIRALSASRVVDLFLVFAPFIGFVVALAPLVGIGLSRSGAELRLTFGFRARTLNLVVIVLCLVVAAILAGHIISESLLEAG